MRYAFKFAYDGINFHGYARQPNVYTVEGAIINTLEILRLINNPKINRFGSASRTDKGVSALGNVIAFDCYYDLSIDVLKEINEELEDIWFYGFREVDQKFYPRFAKLRHYRYYLKVNDDFDFDAFLEGANLFTGERDFKNFCKPGEKRKTVREIKNIIVDKFGNLLSINFFAQTFVWQQVRRIVSALEKLGYHEIDINEVKMALEKPDERRFFGIARGENLVLVDVKYEFEFEFDEVFRGKVKEIEERVIERAMTDSLDRRKSFSR